MTQKTKMPRVTDFDEGVTHYAPDSLSGNVTLCGITDWIGRNHADEDDAYVSCDACKAVFEWCNSHRA